MGDDCQVPCSVLPRDELAAKGMAVPRLHWTTGVRYRGRVGRFRTSDAIENAAPPPRGTPSRRDTLGGERPDPAGVTEEHLPGPKTGGFRQGRSGFFPTPLGVPVVDRGVRLGQ